MKNFKKYTVILLCFLAFIYIGFQVFFAINAREIKEFNRDLENYNVKLQIINQHEKTVGEFMVAIADDDNKKMYGLMNLDHLPANYGMLFEFLIPQNVVMWMKNTKISLDMVFIDKDDNIVNIVTNTTPGSLDLIPSEVKVNRILEINGGTTKKLGIKIGDKIRKL